MAKNIFLVGTARSGSTWTLGVLGQAPGITATEEPDYIVDEARGPGSRGFRSYPVLWPGDRDRNFEALWDVAFAGATPRTAGRIRAGKAFYNLPRALRDPLLPVVARMMSRRPRRTVVKSIRAGFAAEWIAARYQPQVVVLQRDPLNVVPSWIEQAIRHFDIWQRQDIRARYLDRLGIQPPAPSSTHHERAAWCVGLVTTALGEAVKRHPEWILVTHEETCLDPPARFRELFERLDLTWSDSIERYVRDSNQPGEGKATNRVASELPGRWRERLSDDQVVAIQRVLDAFPTRGWVREPAARSEQPA